jgi:glycerol-3-phosphate dehydrogenase
VSQQHEDGPPAVRPTPVPNELQQLEPERRETMIPAAEANWKMVQMSLSGMATALEQIQLRLGPLPELAQSTSALERQHDVTLKQLDSLKGETRLAGGVATEARDMAEAALSQSKAIGNAVDRIESAIGRLAQSIQGIDERTKSLYQTVFPERSNGNGHDHDPEIEYGEIVPMRRYNTGE